MSTRKRHISDTEQDALCAICLDPLEVVGIKSTRTTTLCGHNLHHSCAVRWLTQKETCPLCRKECKLYELEVFEDIIPLPDDTFTYTVDKGSCLEGFDERGNAVYSTSDDYNSDTAARYINITLWSFLEKKYISNCRIKISDASPSYKHDSRYMVGCGAIAISKRTDRFKFSIDVVSITNHFSPLELRGLHWEPKSLYFNYNNTLLACLCDAQITVWDIASGTICAQFPNLRANGDSYHIQVAFGNKDLLHIVYTTPNVLFSYNMQNFEIEKYMPLDEIVS